MTNPKRPAALVLLVTLALCSCTTELTFSRIDPTERIEGVVYHLPATVLVVEATYELVNCIGDKIFEISDVTIKTEVVPDVEKTSTYILNHKKLRAGLKVIDTAKIELHPNRILKKVTYTAKDETREAIKDAAGVATKIGLLASGLPVPAKAGALAAMPVCNKATEEALERKIMLKGQIKSLTQSLNDELAKFPKEKNAEMINAIKAQLDDMTTRLAALRADRLILKSSDRILPRLKPGGEIPAIPVNIKLLSLFKKWFNDSADIEKLQKDNQLLLTFARSAEDPFWACPEQKACPEQDADVRGVVYRLPAQVEVKLNHNKKEYKIPERFYVLQFGRLAKLEVKNGPFQNTKHEIEFDTSGNLTMYNFTESTAQARAIIGAVGDVVPEIANFEQQRLTQKAEVERKKKELAEAEKARIKAERELAEERAK